MTRVFAATTLAAGIAAASAQTLTPGCQSALTNVASNSDAATCMAAGGLLGILATPSNTSLVSPINNWLGSLCSAPACSNNTLDFIVNTVTDGCSGELSLIGYSSNQKDEISSMIKQYYPTVRELVCLKQGNDNCLSKQLKDIESSVGTLSVDNLVKIALGGLSNAANNASAIPKEVYCSDCSKAQYSLINSRIPGALDGSKSEFQSQCGASFTDGQTPAGITTSAAQTSGGNNGASTYSALPTYALLGVGAVFALVA